MSHLGTTAGGGEDVQDLLNMQAQLQNLLDRLVDLMETGQERDEDIGMPPLPESVRDRFFCSCAVGNRLPAFVLTGSTFRPQCCQSSVRDSHCNFVTNHATGNGTFPCLGAHSCSYLPSTDTSLLGPRAEGEQAAEGVAASAATKGNTPRRDQSAKKAADGGVGVEDGEERDSVGELREQRRGAKRQRGPDDDSSEATPASKRRVSFAQTCMWK